MKKYAFKKNVFMAVLLAGVFVPISVSAEPYSVTVNGKLDNAFSEAFDSSFGLDLNHWLGNSYSLQLNFDNDPAQASGSVSNGSESVWSFPQNVNLALNGTLTLAHSGDALGSNEIYIFNNQSLAAGSLPGVSLDISADGLFMGAGYFVGYQGGSAGTVDSVQELVWFNVAAIWSNLATIPNLGLPDLLNAPLNFADANSKWLTIDALRASAVAGQTSVGRLYGTVDSIEIAAVSAVPEPETYAMLLAGLGLLAWKLRRRG